MIPQIYPGFTQPPLRDLNGLYDEFRNTRIWKKDPRTTWVLIEAQASGGGGAGGGGVTQTSATRPGGNGSNGATAVALIPALLVPEVLTVTIGSRGLGGDGGTNVDSVGTPGTTASNTSFGSLIVCPGGIGGIGGQSPSTPDTAAPTIDPRATVLLSAAGRGTAAGNADSANGTPGVSSSGAGTSNLTVAAGGSVYNGGQLIAEGALAPTISSGPAPALPGANGVIGRPMLTLSDLRQGLCRSPYKIGGSGSGASGGAGVTTGTGDGGDGGDGAEGSGGAGGGATVSGNGGDGGDGGTGYVRVWQLFGVFPNA